MLRVRGKYEEEGGEEVDQYVRASLGAACCAPTKDRHASIMGGEKPGLGLANWPEVDLAEKALRALGDNHLDGMGYIFR